jgi:glycosyltransferase involved in cell wall biosynthesis
MNQERDYVTIVHPLILNSGNQPGGVETWIKDYIHFTKKSYLVMGVTSKAGFDSKLSFRQGVHSKSIAELPANRKLIPNLLRVALGLARNRNLLSSVVHIHRIELASLVRVLKPRSKITLFLHTDLKANLSSKSDSIWRLIPWAYYLVEKLSLTCVDEILVYSRHVKSDFEERGINCELGKAWYNDDVFYRPSAPIHRRLIVWIGRFERVKDPELALNVFLKLAEVPGTELRLYGTGSMFPMISEAVKSSNLESKINLMGNVSSFELAEALQETKVLLQTSHFEGSPRAIVEALACGARIVSTTGGDPEGWTLNSKYGHQVSTRDPSEIAKAVISQVEMGEIDQRDLVLDRSASKIAIEIEERYTLV